MAIQAIFKETSFGVGDTIKVHQKVTEVDQSSNEAKKTRTQIFQGMVIDIRGKDMGKTFVVRRIGTQNIGIEQIFPFSSPLLEKIEVVREGKRGVRHAKLYYTRDKSKREIETIYTRAKRRGLVQPEPKKVVKKIAKKSSVKKATKKTKKQV